MEQWLLDISAGIMNAFTVAIFLSALVGVIGGIIIGILPGLGPPVAVSLAIPLTYSLSPSCAIAVMLGLYKGGTYGGSISAILINTPGTPAASATVIDGYPLAKSGKAGKALDIALYGSVFGDAFSIMLLCVIAQPIASVAAKFGPVELFSLLLLAMTIIAGLAGKSLTKGLIAAVLGLAMSIVGVDPVSGMPRFCFGSMYLESGFNVVAIIVGLFAISEQMNQVAHSTGQVGEIARKGSNPDDNRATLSDLRRCVPHFLTGSCIGASIGSLPGTGAAVAAFIGYGIAKKRSKHPEEFGHGSVEGVAAPEAANNAVCGGALIPMLTLGIPGDVVTAVLMGALMLHGIQTGPAIFIEHRVFVFTLFGMLLVSIIMLLFFGKLACKVCRRIADVPTCYLSPIVMILCVAGTYSVGLLSSDVWAMAAFGVVGFILLKLDIPLPPFIIAYILAPQMEQSFRQALLISGGDYSVLVTHPISAFFLAMIVVVIGFLIRAQRRKSRGNLGPKTVSPSGEQAAPIENK